MAIVFIYAFLGGMKGITYTQVAQYCVLIFAYMVPAIFISLMITGHPIPQWGMGAVESETGAFLIDRLNGLHTELGFAPYTDGSKSTLDMLLITAALMVGTAGLPHVIVRFYTVPRVRDARASVGWALVFIAILYTTAPAVALFARTNLIQTVSNQSYSEMPDWFSTWEDTGLMAFDDKNADGRIQFVGPLATDQNGLPVENELEIDKDIMVLANPEIAGLPNWVIGLVAAGGLAAALSTAAGLLLVVSTSISHDLLKKTLNPAISEKKELQAARWSVAVAVLVAGYIGVNPPGFVAQVVAFAFGLAAASFFPAIILGIFSKRMNKEGAIAGMICGILFTAGYIVWFKFIHPEMNTPDHWWLGISPEGIGTVGMTLNFMIALLVSRATPAPSAEITRIVDDIRVPSSLLDSSS